MSQNHNTESIKLKELAHSLDSKFKLPLGIKVGWDGILGLIPGVGDLITTSVSFYIVFKAALLGCSFSVVARMLLNILIDNLVDMVPVIGILFDFGWKSNSKNVQLLENHFSNPARTRNVSKLIVISFVLFSFLLVMSGVILIGYMFVWLFQSMQKSW